MVRCSICLMIVAGIFRLASIANGADHSHPRVPGYERFYAPAPQDKQKQKADEEEDEEHELVHLDPVTGGRILLGELNCTSCHSAENIAKAISPKQAPILNEVGNRVKVEWLREYLAKPHQVKPGTTMPDMISTLPESDREAAVEALTHFLASTGTVVGGRSNATLASKGAATFRKVGCLACHNSDEKNSDKLPTSAALPDLNKKYTIQSLMAFLKDPLRSRPSGRMPNLGLSDEDYRDLAHHFIRDDESNPNVKFAMYHGSWTKLPDFNELKTVSEGTAAGFDLSVADRPNDYAVRFTAYLQITKAGDYEFWIGSDDGSSLKIDDQLIVECDGIHPHETKQGHATLSAGFHKVIVEYFQGGGEASLEVEIAAQGLARQPLSGFSHMEPKIATVETKTKTASFTLDQNLVAKGRQLFASVGCASCHQLKVDGQTINSELKSKPLSTTNTQSGCLAENVSGKAPQYGLTKGQRESLVAAIAGGNAEAPTESIHRTLATLNCYACHVRGKLGGVEKLRDAAFQSLQKEMGDEGRLPPIITGVGDKLRPDWLKHVLHNGANDRSNYMVTKMPRFGPPNVDPLVDLLFSVDQQPETIQKAEFTEPEYRIKAAGRHLVGGQSLSCIKCHDFGPHPSTGVRAINLTTMNQRLRFDWFCRYVVDPQVYRRGTRMPSAWPSGKPTNRETLGGKVDQQVQAVWMFLSDRDKAAVPVGLVREPIELKPESEPIIYRNFIEGAGSRAIGVGYPESVNLAFDANDMRLAMVWHGAFIDASRHWTGRGQGFEPPLGDDILPLPNHVPFIVLDQPDREVSTSIGRDLGIRFLGYQLDSKRRPIFRYALPGLTVEDISVPEKGDGKFATLKRTIDFKGNADTVQLWYRAAVGKSIEPIEGGLFAIDGIWKMNVNSTASEKPIVREIRGQKELLVPIRLKSEKAQIAVHYIW